MSVVACNEPAVGDVRLTSYPAGVAQVYTGVATARVPDKGSADWGWRTVCGYHENRQLQQKWCARPTAARAAAAAATGTAAAPRAPRLCTAGSLTGWVPVVALMVAASLPLHSPAFATNRPSPPRDKLNLAQVICRELSYESAISQSERHALFELAVDETAPYQCNSGNEKSMKQCKEVPSALRTECASALVVECKASEAFSGPAEPRCGSAGVLGQPGLLPGP